MNKNQSFGLLLQMDDDDTVHHHNSNVSPPSVAAYEMKDHHHHHTTAVHRGGGGKALTFIDEGEEASEEDLYDREFEHQIDHLLVLSNHGQKVVVGGGDTTTTTVTVDNGSSSGHGIVSLDKRLRMNSFVQLWNRFFMEDRLWITCRNQPRLLWLLALQSSVLLVLIMNFALVCFKIFLWVYFILLRLVHVLSSSSIMVDNHVGGGGEGHHHHHHQHSFHAHRDHHTHGSQHVSSSSAVEQHLFLSNYLSVPMNGYGIGVFLAPFYAISFYCCLLGILLAMGILLFSGHVWKDTQSQLHGVARWMKRCALIVDSHFSMSCYCILMLTGFIPTNAFTKSKTTNVVASGHSHHQGSGSQSVYFWNSALFFINLCAALGSLFPFLHTDSSSIYLLVLYYLPVYCQVVAHGIGFLILRVIQN